MKKGLVILLLFSAINAYAQDLKRLDFGISVGFSAQRLNLKTFDKPNLPIPTIQRHGSGFDLLIMARYKFNKNLSLRVMPGLIFQDFELLYKSTDENHLEKRDLVEATLPIHFVYNWQTKTRILPSFIAGANVGYTVNPGDKSNKMSINRTNFGVDVGLGGEIKFKRFSCRPELIYTFGNSNISAQSNSPYNTIIRSLTHDRVTFRLIFFG